MAKRKNKGKKQEAVANKPKAPKQKPSRGKPTGRQVATGLTAVNRINELLPNELLAYIFATATLSLLPKEHRSFLAVVCSICRRWRNVAIEASELWTTIYIHHQNHIPTAELFLKRSKTQFLDVDIEVVFGREFPQFTSGRGGYYRSPPVAFSRQSGLRVAELTSAHLERTRTLSLSISDAQGAERFSALYRPVSTPHLVSLSVYIQGWLQSAPPLLDSICSVSSNGSDGLPSNAASGFILTRLELGAIQPEHEDMRKIFTYFPSLETLILPQFCQGWRRNQEVERPIIFAPNSLRSLAVQLDHTHKSSHAGNSPDCSCVLGSLCFPNLEYLEVLGDDSSLDLDFCSHFKDLPKLKTLRLQRCSVSPSDDTFFRSLKLLDRLELVDNLKDVKWCNNYRKKVSLPFPRLSSILLSDNSRGGCPDMFQWARVAQLAIQNYGCTQFSIKVTAQHHNMMTLALSHRPNERIHLETADRPPSLLHPLPPLAGNSFNWPYDDDDHYDYHDSDSDSDSDLYFDEYGFDTFDYENHAEYYGF